MKQIKAFDSFTNLYSLSKTLRFELKPTPETLELLKKTNLNGQTPVEADQEINDLYIKEMKPMFDELHELFIAQTLKTINFNIEDLQALEKLYTELRTLTKEKNSNRERINKIQGKGGEISKIQSKLRQFICEQFEIEAEKWKEKYSDIKLDDDSYKILTSSRILDVLLILYPEKGKHIKKFKSFFTYFSGFNQNRENYYTAEPKAIGVANRIINENYVTFTENKQIFELITREIPKLNEHKKQFELENYENCLTQEAIENFNENIVGKINSEKNLHLQTENSKLKNKDEKIYLRNLKKLYKQIGCRTKQQKDLGDKGLSIYPKYLEKIGLGFQITKDTQEKYEIWQALRYLNDKYSDKLEKLEQNYRYFFTHWQEYNLDEIWFRKESINTISARWFGGDNWNILTNALKETGTGKIEKGEYKIPAFISLWELKHAMDDIPMYEAKNLFREDYRDYFKLSLFDTFLAVWQSEIDFKFRQIPSFLSEFEKKSKEAFDKNKKDENNKSIHIKVVKNLIEDGYLQLYQFTKYHNLEKKGDKDPRPTEGRFYDELDDFWKDNEIVTYHKAFQTTLTKKPFSEEKTKLNFERGNLFTGWSDDKENNHTYQYGSTFIKWHDKIFVVVIAKNNAFSLKKNTDAYNTKESICQLMASKLLKSTTIYGSSYKGKYKSDYKDDKKNLSSVKLIKRIKTILKENVSTFPELQTIIEEKYTDPNALAIKLGEKDFFTPNFVNVKDEFIRKAQKKGEIYLFEITNQNLSAKSHTLNLHTLYFNQLFSDKNLKDGILKLDANAKIFYRKASIPKKVDAKRSKTFEIIENKRYTEDKYLFYFPIKINFTKSKSKSREFNQSICRQIQDYKDIKIIGIDRGEKHLLYYSVVDLNGKMIDKGSLNTINDVDYNAKLQEKQNKRNQARLDWEEIGNIKNFKEGYLSQAIHKIYELLIKYNAIIVMENLNSEFKAKRMAKVEKSVYKKFELALAKKLSHLVLKNKKTNELGGVLNAYQLTPAIPAGDIGKFEKAHQWGIMFYVRANYTSTTDPLTEWRKHLYISNSETDKKIQEFFNPSTGVQIDYDESKKCFKFSYGIQDKTWQLFAFDGLHRLRWNNRDRKMDPQHNLYKEYETLFKDLVLSKNINQQIYGKDFKWKTLVFLWNLLNQIRNIDRDKTGNENDFLQSPVWSEKYKTFYDSRKATEKNLPDNGDANGAYNIARKGVILLQRIKHCPDISKFGNDNNGKDPENSYYISDGTWDEAVSDWDKYVANSKKFISKP